MKFIDSVNKRNISILQAFELLGYDLPDFYKRLPHRELMLWGQRVMFLEDAIRYVKNLLNKK